MTAPDRITIQDVRAAGYCVPGARRWFEAHGFDFKAFLRDGIERDRFLADGDVMAQKVVDHKDAAGG